MPIYEFVCRRTSNPHRFDLMFPMGKCPDSLPCEECFNAADRVISATSSLSGNRFSKPGNIAGDGKGFETKFMRKEEVAEMNRGYRGND